MRQRFKRRTTRRHEVEAGDVDRRTISRHLAQGGLMVPEPRKRTQSSYIRFEATN